MTDYQALFSSCQVTTDYQRLKELDQICLIAMANRPTYESVAAQAHIPWTVIAAIHFRESDQNFFRHLHNGDPLTDKTVHVPVGRPATGVPPFRWEYSAVDALLGRVKPESWNVTSTLEFIECYNGFGYQRHDINTPYLWDWTNQYRSGLFVSDGKFDPDKKEDRPGAVALLLHLQKKGVTLDFISTVTDTVA